MDERTAEQRQAEIVALRGQVADLQGRLEQARQAELHYRLLLDSIREYAIFMLDSYGRISTWSAGAERMHGYRPEEILGQHLVRLYSSDDVQRGSPDQELAQAALEGRHEQDHWLVRKDGSHSWGSVVISVLHDDQGRHAGFSVVMRDITERKQAEEMIRNHAHYDMLTGLPSRAALHDRTAQVLARCRRNNERLAVLFIDLDRFKLINDTFGLAAGDQLLKEVADRLRRCTRQADTLLRLSGDEFLLLAPALSHPEQASSLAQTILDALAEPFMMKDHEIYISSSIGVSLYPQDGEDVELLLKNADSALQRAKELGRDNYQCYTADMNALALERLALESHLRRALERNEIQVYYQPQLEIGSGRLVAVEALVRWQHPYLGLVVPETFWALAEERNLLAPIEEWVLRAACAQIKAWQQHGLGPLRLAVNVSIRQLKQQDLVQTIIRVLQETGLEPHCLELEISESIAMQHQESIAALAELKAVGVRISIDDFGTGYSSFSYLKGSLIDALKIDTSFTRDIPGDPDATAIAVSIIRLAHSLKLEVVAEGVETEAQLALLSAEGCDRYQGYLFSRPLPADALLRLLRDYQARKISSF